MEKLKLHKNSSEYKQLKHILDNEVLKMRAKLLQKTLDEAHATIEKIDRAEDDAEEEKLFKHLERVKKDLELYWYGLNSLDLLYEQLTNGHNIYNTLYEEAKKLGLQEAFDFHPSKIDELKY